MNKLAISLAVGILFSTAVTAESKSERALSKEPSHSAASVRVIVKYKPSTMFSRSEQGANGVRVLETTAAEVKALAEQLNHRPEVEDVALDYMTTTPPVLSQNTQGVMTNHAAFNPAGAPTDPGFSAQHSWESPNEIVQGYQDTLAAYLDADRKISVRVGVIDSGFMPVADIIWDEGANVVSTQGESYGPAFYEHENDSTCTDPHGNGVAAIIGAESNNGVGIAGIVDAEMVATRVMRCGTGSLYDASMAIRWLAGDSSIKGLPTLSEPVQIINASLGAEVNQCPFYLQDAINFAFERGILIVAAAGNESMNASKSSPANCGKVLTVGAVEATGLAAGFSNFGTKVDIAALGELVGSIGREDTPVSWFGTSFSAPIVTGISALIMQENPLLGNDGVAEILVSTSRPQIVGSLEVGGIADAKAAIAAVKAQVEANRPEIRPALNNVMSCNYDAYIQNAPKGTNFKELYEVTVPDIVRDEHSEYFAVFKENQAGIKEVITLTSEDVFLIENVNPETDSLFFDVCDETAKNCRFNKKQNI